MQLHNAKKIPINFPQTIHKSYNTSIQALGNVFNHNPNVFESAPEARMNSPPMIFSYRPCHGRARGEIPCPVSCKKSPNSSRASIPIKSKSCIELNRFTPISA
ncbi:hypothetical protein BN874_420040 [Candidatus Contendobacter odensis Run_B_J11]|uniref:Uncharacterized protein n=1 Tax=Candidatus Contendobacter odensis Run_B_J11 TaxID=1400861 RepID=A0A7U7J546_9GAMM|nr:hypothetical protein BN874_420040 [Candidatus Contendobacter odensis Run_B_J11]